MPLVFALASARAVERAAGLQSRLFSRLLFNPL
jgi:hypothetical protein